MGCEALTPFSLFLTPFSFSARKDNPRFSTSPDRFAFGEPFSFPWPRTRPTPSGFAAGQPSDRVSNAWKRTPHSLPTSGNPDASSLPRGRIDACERPRCGFAAHAGTLGFSEQYAVCSWQLFRLLSTANWHAANWHAHCQPVSRTRYTRNLRYETAGVQFFSSNPFVISSARSSGTLIQRK